MIRAGSFAGSKSWFSVWAYFVEKWQMHLLGSLVKWGAWDPFFAKRELRGVLVIETW